MSIPMNGDKYGNVKHASLFSLPISDLVPAPSLDVAVRFLCQLQSAMPTSFQRLNISP